jgi:hypothetical protein
MHEANPVGPRPDAGIYALHMKLHGVSPRIIG